MGISEDSATVAGETETFCGHNVMAGATEHLSEVGGTKGKEVRAEVPFLAGWLLGAKETVSSRKGLAVLVGVEVPLVVVGVPPEAAALSKGNVATLGAVREPLRSRLVGSGPESVLSRGAGEIAPSGEGVVAGGLPTGRGSSLFLLAKVASGQRDTSREDDVLWGEGGF